MDRVSEDLQAHEAEQAALLERAEQNQELVYKALHDNAVNNPAIFRGMAERYYETGAIEALLRLVIIDRKEAEYALWQMAEASYERQVRLRCSMYASESDVPKWGETEKDSTDLALEIQSLVMLEE